MDQGNPYVMAIITQFGIGFTALCTLIGVIIQVRSNNKARKNEDLVKVIDGKLDKMKADSEKSDRELRQCMDEHHLRYYKDQLVSMLSRIENGYKPTVEEKHILHEQKAKYNEMGRGQLCGRNVGQVNQKRFNLKIEISKVLRGETCRI